MTLDDKQSGVLKGILAGAVITIAAIVAAILTNPFPQVSGGTLAERFAFALKADSLVVLALAAAIATLARHRFFSPHDIDGSGLTGGSARATILQSRLQNTLEQAVLAISVHMIWVASMPASWISVVPVAAVLFVAGRILFARGYSDGAAARSLGFALTFYPSVLMILLIVIGAVVSMVG